MIGGVLVAREAEVDDERRGHHAGERVGELEQDDEGEDGDRHVAREEIGEGADRRREHALQWRHARVGGVGDLRFLRLGGGQSEITMPKRTSPAIAT